MLRSELSFMLQSSSPPDTECVNVVIAGTSRFTRPMDWSSGFSGGRQDNKMKRL
jgi:hypothetical protein